MWYEEENKIYKLFLDEHLLNDMASAGMWRYFGGDTVNGYYTFYGLVLIHSTHSVELKEYEWLFTCITKLLSKENRAVKIPKMFKLFRNIAGRKALLSVSNGQELAFRQQPAQYCLQQQ